MRKLEPECGGQGSRITNWAIQELEILTHHSDSQIPRNNFKVDAI